MAHGVADNMLITTYLSMKAPVFIAPAMDLDMYAHPSTQQNMRTLASYGNRFIEPASGFLASGLEGKGRMEEPEVIARRVSEFFDQNDSNSPLKGKRIVITAGPTYEKIDRCASSATTQAARWASLSPRSVAAVVLMLRS